MGGSRKTAGRGWTRHAAAARLSVGPDGPMPNFAANLSMMFQELPFLARVEAAATAGFKAVEFLFPYDFSAADIRQRLDRFGLRQVLFNLPPGDWAKGERGLSIFPARADEFAAGLDKALEYAAAL